MTLIETMTVGFGRARRDSIGGMKFLRQRMPWAFRVGGYVGELGEYPREKTRHRMAETIRPGECFDTCLLCGGPLFHKDAWTAWCGPARVSDSYMPVVDVGACGWVGAYNAFGLPVWVRESAPWKT